MGKYFRIVLSTFFLGLIIPNFSFSAKKIINIISIILFLHLLAIAVQILFPSIVNPMAGFFNFDRDTELLDRLTIRNLGLAGSFDFAALLSVFGIYVFYLQYKNTKKIMFLILFLLAFLSCFRISRMAMILGFFVFISISFILLKNLSLFKKILITPILVGVFIVVFNFAFPILVGSLSFLQKTSLNKGYVIDRAEYSTSDKTLLDRHLFFPESTYKSIIGEGVKISGTDIGYVKTIFSIGIIGLLLIIMQYLYMIRRVRKIKKRKTSTELVQLCNYFIFFTIMLFVVNLKILLLYSRGAHEFVLLMFFTILTLHNMADTNDNKIENFNVRETTF
ncbi:MAG: hypothetical protein JEY96_02055 [Bacteroidales bacterium]|nr:hypothetical protein [Bacteroidales bacterium]